MRLEKLQGRFARIFTQRCFLLFAALIALIVVAPWLGATPQGRFMLNGVQALVLIAAVAAVGRTPMPFGIALLLGIPAVIFMFMVQVDPEEKTHYVIVAQAFFLAFYVVTIFYLLGYVFNPQVMTEDKLFGAAAAYLMLGILWAYAYSLLQVFEPLAFRSDPAKPAPGFYDLLYMSFGCLTSTGPGDLAPVNPKARSLVIIEQVFGVLYVAILIARLAGGYTPGGTPPPDRT